MNERLDYDAIRARVDHKLKHQRLFFAHLIIFLLCMGVAATGIIPENMLTIVLILWAVLFPAHKIYVNSIGKHESEIEQEIQHPLTS